MTEYNSEEHKQNYLGYHQKRFDSLINEVLGISGSDQIRILDIGRSPFTKILFKKFSHVYTLGLKLTATLLDKADPIDEEKVPHLVYDLNKSSKRKSWIKDKEGFDIILFAEVVEHLTVSPKTVLIFLYSLLKPGGFIILQTPNAVSISKRLKMLVGFNPFDTFNEDGETGAHHYREYTKRELKKEASAAGFKLIRHQYLNYFNFPGSASKLLNGIFGVVPNLRTGQTLVLQRN